MYIKYGPKIEGGTQHININLNALATVAWPHVVLFKSTTIHLIVWEHLSSLTFAKKYLFRSKELKLKVHI